MDDGNETDVREEIAAPFLSALGYKRGTENNITREWSIDYGKAFLGRKKPNDPPLRGRPDYVLSVIGAGRWVLEVKAPSVEITREEIDQAISYARHPHVSAAYAVVLNGRQLVVMHWSQTSADKPILTLEVQTGEQLASNVSGFLSPAAIRRDCSPPVVDVKKPLADGFRSSARIMNGVLTIARFSWQCDLPLPPQARAPIDDMLRRMSGMRSDITGGHVARDESTSRITAKLAWSVPHVELLSFMSDKKIQDAEYVSLDEEISCDPSRPTAFDVVDEIRISKGETIFDVSRWQSHLIGFDTSMTYGGRATGCLNKNIFAGDFFTDYDATFPALPGAMVRVSTEGSFEIVLDPR